MASVISSKVSFMFKSLGHHTRVANNPVAKLMFYMHCVESVLDTNFDNISSLINYEDYMLMTEPEIDQLLEVCLIFNPTVMEGNCFLENEAWCKGFTNDFLELSSVSETLVVSPNVIAGERTCVVKKVMAHCNEYYQKKYYSPMKTLMPWIEAMHQHESSRPIRRCRVKIPPKYPFDDIEKFSDNVSANILISYFFPLWLLGWILMSIFQTTPKNRSDLPQ